MNLTSQKTECKFDLSLVYTCKPRIIKTFANICINFRDSYEVLNMKYIPENSSSDIYVIFLALQRTCWQWQVYNSEPCSPSSLTERHYNLLLILYSKVRDFNYYYSYSLYTMILLCPTNEYTLTIKTHAEYIEEDGVRGEERFYAWCFSRSF